jgi:hypothetical protein
MFDTDLSIRAVGTTTWELTAPLTWVGERDTFIVPVGFVTDFATVPRFLLWLFRPYGPYTRAAVLHDWLLVELAASTRAHPNHGPGSCACPAPPATSRDIDGIFRAAARDLGTPAIVRWPMWAGVRIGSCFSHRRAYGRGFAKDAPKVVGIGVLVLGTGVIPIASLAVLIALGVVRVIVFLSGGRPAVRMSRRGRLAGRDPKGK